MSSSTAEKDSFTRPGFITAAVLIALIVAAGVALGILNVTRKAPAPVPPDTQSIAPSTPQIEPSKVHGGVSVCALPGEVLEGTLATAPSAEWEFQGTTAYPTSAKFGPGETNTDGVRYCFQHSPEGAVFAAANAVVQGSDAAISSKWIGYFLSAKTPNRSTLLNQVAAGSSSSNRMTVVGFRLLAYDDTSARVDIAIQATGSGNTVFASAIYDLVWEDGDWKLLPQDLSNPLRLAEIPDTAGYITWKA